MSGELIFLLVIILFVGVTIAAIQIHKHRERIKLEIIERLKFKDFIEPRRVHVSERADKNSQRAGRTAEQEKSKEELGWQPVIPWEETLAEVLAERNQPDN